MYSTFPPTNQPPQPKRLSKNGNSRSSSPRRKPLHERSDSQTNELSSTSIRLVEDSDPHIYAKTPFPNHHSQVFAPRNVPGYMFEDQGYGVSDEKPTPPSIPPRNARRQSTQPAEPLAPKQLPTIERLVPRSLLPQTGRDSKRGSLSTIASEAETSFTGTPFTGTPFFTPSSRFSGITTPPTSPLPYQGERVGGLGIQQEESSKQKKRKSLQKPTVRAVIPSNATVAHHLITRPSEVSLSSSGESDAETVIPGVPDISCEERRDSANTDATVRPQRTKKRTDSDESRSVKRASASKRSLQRSQPKDPSDSANDPPGSSHSYGDRPRSASSPAAAPSFPPSQQASGSRYYGHHRTAASVPAGAQFAPYQTGYATPSRPSHRHYRSNEVSPTSTAGFSNYGTIGPEAAPYSRYRNHAYDPAASAAPAYAHQRTAGPVTGASYASYQPAVSSPLGATHASYRAAATNPPGIVYPNFWAFSPSPPETSYSPYRPFATTPDPVIYAPAYGRTSATPDPSIYATSNAFSPSSTLSTAYSPYQATVHTAVQVQYPVIRAPLANPLFAESQPLPKPPTRPMPEFSARAQQWSSQLSTIQSESERGTIRSESPRGSLSFVDPPPDRQSLRTKPSAQSAELRAKEPVPAPATAEVPVEEPIEEQPQAEAAPVPAVEASPRKSVETARLLKRDSEENLPRKQSEESKAESSQAELPSSQPSQSSAVPKPLFAGPRSENVQIISRDSDERQDTLGALPSPTLRPQRSGYFSRHPADSRPTSANSNRSFIQTVIPAWARFYYRSGEQTPLEVAESSTDSDSRLNTAQSSGPSNSPVEGHFPFSIYRPRNRPRQGQGRRGGSHHEEATRDSMEITALPTQQDVYVTGPPRPKISEPFTPRLRQDKRTQTEMNYWRAPSFDEALESLVLSRGNRQILLFCLGFLFPLCWIIASFLPLPPRPDVPVTPSQADIERAMREKVGAIDERRFHKARWWRMLNRAMSIVGIVLIAVIIALAVVASRMSSLKSKS